MIFNNCKSLLAANLHQIPGWKTNRKIVVFESDDWGSIRMPSLKTYNALLKGGLKIGDHYNRNDSLATGNDLEALFEVLTSFKDSLGRHPVITANCLVTNPDFDRIKKDNFQQYYFELFTETLSKQTGCENSFNLWKEGMNLGIFLPQFHGREHLNVALWMQALTEKHRETLFAFDYGFWGQETDYPFAKRKHFMAAYDFNLSSQIRGIKKIVEEGLLIFENIFGYRSKSFIAPNFIWDPGIESTFKDCGVTYIQSQRKQLIPVHANTKYKKSEHFIGQMNAHEQTYLVRNASFEPTSDRRLDWVNLCLKDISRAFLWKKPAIISTHRVNFIGSIEYENRNLNLSLLTQLLKELMKKWPDVEFKSSNELGDIITTS